MRPVVLPWVLLSLSMGLVRKNSNNKQTKRMPIPAYGNILLTLYLKSSCLTMPFWGSTITEFKPSMVIFPRWNNSTVKLSALKAYGLTKGWWIVFLTQAVLMSLEYFAEILQRVYAKCWKWVRKASEIQLMDKLYRESHLTGKHPGITGQPQEPKASQITSGAHKSSFSQQLWLFYTS